MFVRFMHRCAYLILALAIAPLLMAGTKSANDVNEMSSTRSEASDWNLHQEASTLLTRVHTMAYQVTDESYLLRSYNRTPNLVGWQSDAALLDRIRTHVNDMDQMISRLREMRGKVLPWQRKAIDQITPGVIELTDYTQNAIGYLNGHHHYLWNPDYAADSRYISMAASEVASLADRYTEYATDMRTARKLGRQLGLKERS
jgi:hypothetical protein